ncbi:hypothetical protein [Microbacterium aoyamense]|uniref:hypothetical protein n=1 Tax=Microbacterium aoyamense TaxID=344166 RepID=UPI0031D611E8
MTWCSGRWLDHGGDGEPPERWLHADDDGIDLPHGAILYQSQEGAGPGSVMLVNDKMELATAASMTDLIRILRALADAIELVEGNRQR